MWRGYAEKLKDNLQQAFNSGEMSHTAFGGRKISVETRPFRLWQYREGLPPELRRIIIGEPSEETNGEANGGGN